MSEMPKSPIQSNYPRANKDFRTPETEQLLRDFWGTVAMYAIASLCCGGLAWLMLYSRSKQAVRSNVYGQVVREHAAYAATLSLVGIGISAIGLILYPANRQFGIVEVRAMLTFSHYILSIYTIYRAFRLRPNPDALGEGPLVRYSLQRYRLDRKELS